MRWLGGHFRRTMEKAIWCPFWYEMDQAIEIGIIAQYEFFINPPKYVDAQNLPVFFHGSWKDRDLYYSAFKRIVAIRHSELGDIMKIDASGLVYSITLLDGTVHRVEAEEQTPGDVYDFPR
jgi:hypothetical protein